MKTNEERITELELIVMHQQKMLTDFNEVLIDAQRRIDLLHREVKRLGDDSQLLRSLQAEIRRPEDEKPPHY